ncbi:hypothetical protein D3C72_1109230 [compost metagenome]
MELGKGGGHVADVAHGVTHAHEIAAGVGPGQGLGDALNQFDARQPDLAHHAHAGVDAGELAGGADELQGFAGDEPGADAHVEHLRARREAGLLQRVATVRGAGAEGQHGFDAVVVRGRAVEDAPQERLVLRFGVVVQRQRGVRRQGVGISRTGNGRWRHRTIITKRSGPKSRAPGERCVRRTVNSTLALKTHDSERESHGRT